MFHRWHHTSADEGRDKNFAGALPLWDLVFGTYYMPREQPVVFGISEEIPDELIGQMIWPFRADASSSTSSNTNTVVIPAGAER
jgi:sterol desaturase/sphingolipid hydroxylase (fatty acid hydroxylase superfamily)